MIITYCLLIMTGNKISMDHGHLKASVGKEIKMFINLNLIETFV